MRLESLAEAGQAIQRADAEALRFSCLIAMMFFQRDGG